MPMLESPVMQIPETASVKPLSEAALGSLLVGRFGPSQTNFVAIRTKRLEPTGDPTPLMIILSAWIDGQDRPYLYGVPDDQTKVLDLGVDCWSVDVSINESAPSFQLNSLVILIRCGTDFFLRLSAGHGFLDLTKWVVNNDLPDDCKYGACWTAFDIYLSQPGVEGPGEKIFCWPRKEIPEA